MWLSTKLGSCNTTTPVPCMTLPPKLKASVRQSSEAHQSLGWLWSALFPGLRVVVVLIHLMRCVLLLPQQFLLPSPRDLLPGPSSLPPL